MLFPGYSPKKNSSILDAVAFTGLQREMLYSQKFEGMTYRNPYVEHRPLTTPKSIEEGDSLWKDTAYYTTSATNSFGNILELYQDPSSMEIFGITDENEIFLLNQQL